jgi:hypothetical protein
MSDFDMIFDEIFSDKKNITSGDTVMVEKNNESFTIDDSPMIENIFPSQKVEGIQPVDGDSDNDFLKWLSDVNDSSNSSGSKVVVNKDQTIDTTDKETIKPLSMDNFLDEVFGDQAISLKALHTSKVVTQSISFPIEEAKKPKIDYLIELEILLNSKFPDVEKMRILLLRHIGYVPKKFRGRLWNFLLTGNSIEDGEASSSGQSNCNFSNSKIMMSHIKQLSKSITTIDENSYLYKSFVRILELYYSRRQVEYDHYYSILLSPILLSTEPMKLSLASSCFYNLASEFIPLISLKV